MKNWIIKYRQNKINHYYNKIKVNKIKKVKYKVNIRVNNIIVIKIWNHNNIIINIWMIIVY